VGNTQAARHGWQRPTLCQNAVPPSASTHTTANSNRCHAPVCDKMPGGRQLAYVLALASCDRSAGARRRWRGLTRRRLPPARVAHWNRSGRQQWRQLLHRGDGKVTVTGNRGKQGSSRCSPPARLPPHGAPGRPPRRGSHGPKLDACTSAARAIQSPADRPLTKLRRLAARSRSLSSCHGGGWPRSLARAATSCCIVRASSCTGTGGAQRGRAGWRGAVGDLRAGRPLANAASNPPKARNGQ